ncbi:hypothetical protein V7124_19660 [Neobacillus niacini]|uniref:hypothetical protein n=1 Tax=Neobacillus niacini TaxID=86668 RepID=UPI0030003750
MVMIRPIGERETQLRAIYEHKLETQYIRLLNAMIKTLKRDFDFDDNKIDKFTDGVRERLEKTDRF